MPAINVEEYVLELIAQLQKVFYNRLVYVGLQGSFRRGEADDNSDIDVMVTLDRLDPGDLDLYREVITAMPHADRSCGFISGRNELKNWPRHEICLLLHETKNYYGELSSLIPEFTRNDVINYVMISVANLYHMLCHSRVHSGGVDAEMLKGLYKAVFYILQNAYYLESEKWIMTKAELLSRLHGVDHDVLKTAMKLKSVSEYDTNKAYNLLFTWCQKYFKGVL